jgi:hypothetical protein
MVHEIAEERPTIFSLKYLQAERGIYCDIFAESRGTLLGNGITNASPLQRKTRGIPGSGVFYSVRRQENSDATTGHITLPHKPTKQPRGEMFSVRTVPRLYNDD